MPEGREQGKAYAKSIKETNGHIFGIPTGLMYSVRNTFDNKGLCSPSLLQELILGTSAPTQEGNYVYVNLPSCSNHFTKHLYVKRTWCAL